jgi:hypothetical protein
MDRRRATRRLILAGAAIGGAVLGHLLTYLLTVPQASVRAALLARTGHGYWPAALAAAIVLGAFALLTTMIRAFLQGFRGWHGRRADVAPARRPLRDTARIAVVGERLERFAARLVLLQVGIYVVQETIERVVAGAAVVGLLHGEVLPVGILVQTLVALLAALALGLLGGAAKAAGRAVARLTRRRGQLEPPVTGRRRAASPRKPARSARPLGSRAPPSAPATT